MKNLKLFVIYIIGLFSLFCVFLSLNAEADYLDKIEFQPIAKEKVNETLELLSTAIQSNYQQIRTWQTDIDVHTETVYSGGDYIESVFRKIVKYKGTLPKNTLGRSNRKISFVLDIQTENLYQRSVRQGPVRYYDDKDNNEIAAVAGPFDQAYIVTPTYYIDCMDVKKKGDVITGYRAIKRKVRNQRETIAKNGIFDPRHFIYMIEPIWNCLDTWRKNLNEHGGDWKVGPYSGKFEEGRDGNDIVYHLSLPGKASENEYVFLNLFFSEKAGWNIVKNELQTQDNKIFGRTTVEYYTLDGIYVPKKITEYTFNEDQSISNIEDYIFTKQLLNKDVAKNTFTYETLGLKNGDNVIDEIEGKKYKYQDANLVLIVEPNNPPK